ncbi:MAG: hypothetical protein PHC66_03505 [Candidatus Nanoarchaeia archaeon]|nr:hypothetical protein [Candidatus Nanoarchaeia archaeon]MDD5239802.1 hypothetical protein [Candidatus Nanoarchaeia archaeon]
MVLIKLRPHHVSRIIDYYKNYIGIEGLKSDRNYTRATSDKIVDLIKHLISDPTQQIEIIGNDEIGEDTICSLCNNNSGGVCTVLGGPEKIEAHNSSDQREALRYQLRQGVYTIGELLKREPVFDSHFRI